MNKIAFQWNKMWTRVTQTMMSIYRFFFVFKFSNFQNLYTLINQFTNTRKSSQVNSNKITLINFQLCRKCQNLEGRFVCVIFGTNMFTENNKTEIRFAKQRFEYLLMACFFFACCMAVLHWNPKINLLNRFLLYVVPFKFWVI